MVDPCTVVSLPMERFASSVDAWPIGCGWATPSMWRTSRLRLSEIANRKTCADSQPPGAVRAKCRCVAVRLWLRTYIQQLSDAVAVDDFKSAAV